VKVMTLGGTRPEWIRLCLIIPKLDQLCEHILVDTGQNYDSTLRDVFFKDLQIREPDYQLGAVGTFAEQLSILMPKLERIILKEKPNAFLVLGDTNSSLGAIVAKRLGIKVFHMEAGNRCFDDQVPEEVNRRLIDHSSDILLPYTNRSRQNLLDEGIHSSRIYVTGNPITEVMEMFHDEIGRSDILNIA
jgi:UDP-N-acetylglucosamine 2-epimerase (non-hydrolysing)